MSRSVSNTKEKPRLVLYVHQHKLRQYDTQSTTYELSVLMVEPEDDHPRNISRTSQEYRFPGIGIFEDLQIRCYLSWYRGQFNATSWDVGYHGHMSMDSVAEAEQKVKGLKLVHKIRTAMLVQPATFGQFAVLMAAGFGVRECCRERDDNKGQMYSDHQWQLGPLPYAQGWIDEEIERLRKKYAPIPEAA